VHITAVTSLDPPTVTSPVTLCQFDVATPLTATGAAGSIMRWYTTDTGLTVSLPGAPTPVTTTPGTKWYFVRQTSGTCVSPPDSVEVIVNPQPQPPGLSGPTIYCQDATFVPFTSSGSSILWYTAPTGGTGSATPPTVPTATPGVYDYYATQTVLGCESPRTAITVTVNPTSATPVMTAGQLIYCQFEPFIPFAVTGTNVLWYTVSTGGTGVPTAPVINTDVAGFYDYYVTETDALGCESARLHLHIIVYAKPAPPLVVSPTYCQYTPPTPLTAIGTALLWYGPGVTPPSGTTPTPSTAITGTTDYYVTQTINGCVSDSALITVTVDSTPEAPTAYSNSPVCQGDTLFLFAATPTAGVSYNWAGPAGYTDTHQNPSVLNVLPSATGFYTVTATLGSCSAAAVISVSITATPPLVVGNNSPICTGIKDTVYLSAESGPGAVYSWTGPYVFTSSAQNPFRTPVIAEYGGEYIMTVLLDGCIATASTFVNVNQTPQAPWVKWLTYCQYYDAPPLMAGGSNILWYTSSIGSTSTPVAPVPATAATGWKFYFATQTVSGCESGIDSIKVQVNPKPVVTLDPPTATVCPRDSVVLVATDTDPIAYYHWFPAMYIYDTTSPSIVARSITDMNYFVVATNQFGCTDTATSVVTVHSGAVITLTDSVTLYPGETFQVDLQTNCTTFRWTPSGGLDNAFISDPVASPEVSTRYFVTGRTEWGCKTRDSIDVNVTTDAILVLPNAFAPGGGSNSTFRIIRKGEAVLHDFRIYDRWGVVVFETKDINAGWDGIFKGVPQPLGVYVYEVTAVAGDGKAFNMKGNLTLLR
jgi:gliding motility-associated-like protein